MMIIVYISLAVVLASLAYLIYAGVSFNKNQANCELCKRHFSTSSKRN